MKLTREQECIKELYSLLNTIESAAKRKDLSLFQVRGGVRGTDVYSGLPPICRAMDAISDKYEDIIHECFNIKNKTCSECEYFIDGGDWNLCCSQKHENFNSIFSFLCYEDTEACEKFKERDF